MLNSVLSRTPIVGGFLENYSLPPRARELKRVDLSGHPQCELQVEDSISLAYKWLCLAQDRNELGDGGVSRHYSLLDGWSSSYPETTGYIVPTFIELAKLGLFEDASKRAKRMLDWLMGIQFKDGGFQGGLVDATPKVPVTFNTGQILIGLAAGLDYFGQKYESPVNLAATWLVESQDEDGCWRRYPTPFAKPGEKAYETHVSWGLLEAAKVTKNEHFGKAALKNIDWSLTKQTKNGWFESCCLNHPSAPLTHTIGYVLRGILEGYAYSGDKRYLNSVILAADNILKNIHLPNGYLAGRFTKDWKPAVEWSCLTGSVQIAHCLFTLGKETGEASYTNAAKALNKYVRATVITSGEPNTIGGIRGSFPVSGEYGQYEFLNWGAKFFIDSHLVEKSF